MLSSYKVCDNGNVIEQCNFQNNYVHRVWKKGTDSILAVTLTNLDNFSVFGTNHPDNPCD